MTIDYNARLTAVSAAIAAILAGAQQVEYNGRMVKKADLDTLLKEEQRLENKITRGARGGIRARTGVPMQ